AAEQSEKIVQEAIQAGLAGYVPRLSRQMIGLPTAVGLALARVKERRAIEETCRQYRRLVDTVPVGLYRTTPAGRILDANLTFAHMLGYPDRAALLALNVTELYANPQARERWRAMPAQPEAINFFETQFYRYDGTTIWVENSVNLVRDSQNHVLYYEGILKDISQRQQARLAWQESEERFRTIVEQSPISIQVMTPDGWTIQVNRAWEKLWGVTAADVKNYNLRHDEQVIGLGMMPYVERGFAGETVLLPPVAYHTPESLKTGRRRWFQARIYPVKGERGEIRNVIMMYEDITEHQWATEDLQRLSLELMNAQETERKHVSQELHDELGQALTAMRINFDMLEKELPPDAAAAGRERLAEISMLVDETLEHVRELSHTLRPTMLDEMGLVPTLRWYASRYAERLGIQVEFDVTNLEDRLAAEIETTLYRIVQEALTNIARHAQAHRVHLHLAGQEARVSALIEDDGLGFDVQTKLAAGIARSGIGLFRMRERVALWGGTFSIRSRPGQGTRLFVELPLSPRLVAREP
ncbi:MAG: PAS domain S-box protein, partial [Chloroflexota bacterium]